MTVAISDYERLRDDNNLLREQLAHALDASALKSDVSELQLGALDPIAAFVASARIVIAEYNALLSLRDVSRRGTADMPDDKLQARLAVMSVAEGIIEKRLVDDFRHIVKLVKQIELNDEQTTTDQHIDKTSP